MLLDVRRVEQRTLPRKFLENFQPPRQSSQVPNSYDLDMATFRRPLEDCLDLCLCADYLQIGEPWSAGARLRFLCRVFPGGARRF